MKERADAKEKKKAEKEAKKQEQEAARKAFVAGDK